MTEVKEHIKSMLRKIPMSQAQDANTAKSTEGADVTYTPTPTGEGKDLVERLRQAADPFWYHTRDELIQEAASRISTLEGERDALTARIDLMEANSNISALASTREDAVRVASSEEEIGGFLATIASLTTTLEEVKAERDEAYRRLDVYIEDAQKLLDPNAVHANMLRGTIAKPSIEQIKHLYPELTTTLEELRRAVEPKATIYNCEHITRHRGCVWHERNWSKDITPRRCSGCPNHASGEQPAELSFPDETSQEVEGGHENLSSRLEELRQAVIEAEPHLRRLSNHDGNVATRPSLVAANRLRSALYTVRSALSTKTEGGE